VGKVGKKEKKKEDAAGAPFHQVSSVAVIRPIFARFKAAFAAKPNIVHYNVFYLVLSHVIYHTIYAVPDLEISINPTGILSVRNIPVTKGGKERNYWNVALNLREFAPAKKMHLRTHYYY